MKRILLVIVFFIVGCSIPMLLPKACVTFKVVDEHGSPMKNITVGVGFVKNTGSGSTAKGVDGKTDSNGMFKASDKTIKLITYIINEQGYYKSSGRYDFDRVVGGEWQPWNPEIKIVLRKIENPVPMFARRFGNILPLKDKDIGCDLIANDWVKPYGKGTHSDIVFHLKKRYVNDNDFSADLHVRFPNKNDGFIKYDLNMYNGSEFKLPRYAPADGYGKQFNRHQDSLPGRSLRDDDRKDNIGYVFRVRSFSSDSVMYGKIQGDIHMSGIRNDTVDFGFTYYINPDHTRNLEFDPKRNLFTDLKSFERVGL